MHNLKTQFGRISSMEALMMAGVLALCTQVVSSRFFPAEAHEGLQTEISALERANAKRNQLDRISLQLNLIRVDDATVSLPEADCKFVRSAAGQPKKLLAEFLSANDTYYQYHAQDPMTPTRQGYDIRAMTHSAQESDRMIARRMEYCH
jgi:hypothetical protein